VTFHERQTLHAVVEQTGQDHPDDAPAVLARGRPEEAGRSPDGIRARAVRA
jgi:hypothetical protein